MLIHHTHSECVAFSLARVSALSPQISWHYLRFEWKVPIPLSRYAVSAMAQQEIIEMETRRDARRL